MKLRQFIKEEIKHEAALLKQTKPLGRQIQSLWDRGLGESEEYVAKSAKRSELNKLYRFPNETRYLYLAYAKVRGRDWRTLEKYPEKINEKTIDSVIEFLTKNHAAAYPQSVTEAGHE